MTPDELKELPIGAILMVIKNENGTFSPLGINHETSQIVSTFVGMLSNKSPLVVAKEVQLSYLEIGI